MIAANLSAAFNLTQAVVPVLRSQGGGLIIYVSSAAAKKPDRSSVAYQASKAGVVGLAHGTMEEERQHGIRTTVIFPGLTDTPLVLKRPTPAPRGARERLTTGGHCRGVSVRLPPPGPCPRPGGSFSPQPAVRFRE